MSATALRIVEGVAIDGSKALSAALSQIERQLGEGSVMKLRRERRPVRWTSRPLSSGWLGLERRAQRRRTAEKGRVVEDVGPDLG